MAPGLTSNDSHKDQRVRRVKLTAKGNKAFKDALPHWEGVQLKVVAGLGLKRWSGLLDDLAATVDEVRSN